MAREEMPVVPSLTVENYVKTIFQIVSAQEDRPATTGQIAAALEVSPGTVTSMLKTLDAARLATHMPYEGVALTRSGRVLALRVLRRHRLLELFLLRTLDMSWDEVHDEAEHMEHAVSDLLVDRIDAFLGHPDVDPHGDPIPRADGDTPRLDCDVEDVIDMVGMVFVYILQDRHLPATVKAVLAKLQIPILKVALLDRAFFAKKNHPARLLLNSLAQAGMGLDGGAEADGPVYQKIEAVVGLIVAEWDRNVGLFYELLGDFTAFMALEYRRNRAAEERTRQATQSREQILQAKKAAAYVIASRLRGAESAPLVLKSFLCNAWKDVLVLAWLRRKKDREDWDSAIGLMDQLIGGITSPLAAQAPGSKNPVAPALLASMKSRLEDLAYERHWIVALLKELEDFRGEPARDAREQAADRSHWRSVPIEDADFAALLGEVEDGMARSEGFPQAAASLPEAARARAGKTPGGVLEEYGLDDEFIGKASALEVGQWLEFHEGGRRPRRAKLSWKSLESDAHIFVNAKGAKVVEMTLADLARCLSSGAAKIIEDSSIPLMDRALSRLMQALENPACALVP